MNRRLSYISTAIIFVLSFLLVGAFLVWLTATYNLPDWVMTIGEIFFFLLVFEIPARLGPHPFETPLSSLLKLPARDKPILIISFMLFGVILIVTDAFKDQLNWISKLGLAVLLFVFLLGPISLFGSPEAKKLVFYRNKNLGSSEQQ